MKREVEVRVLRYTVDMTLNKCCSDSFLRFLAEIYIFFQASLDINQDAVYDFHFFVFVCNADSSRAHIWGLYNSLGGNIFHLQPSRRPGK